ncbi:MAG TPA: hypothetical protein VLH60_07540, partial [Sedimentisphaerales bacterium]|nr:hypothetical protein [Sedimentisphaerales bacterium]
MTEDRPTHSTRQSTFTAPPAGLLKYKRAIIIVLHAVMFFASLLLAFLMANDMSFTRGGWLTGQFPQVLLFVMLIKLIVFGLLRQYTGWWRYVGITDLLGIARASLLSTVVIVLLYFTVMFTPLANYFSDIRFVQQSVWLLDMFATVLLLGGLRMTIRLYHEEFCVEDAGGPKRLVIIGAGDAGEALLREIHRMKKNLYEVIGFLDDNPAKHGMSIHGIR